MSSALKLVPLGKVVREWGVRGEVKFRSYNPQSDLYSTLKKIYLEGPSGWQELVIESVRRHGAFWLFKLAGFENPETSQALRGRQLGIPRGELPEPEKGERYISDLIGRAVLDPSGNTMGKVRGMLMIGETDCLVIDRGEGEEAIIPWHERFVEPASGEGAIQLKLAAKELL